MSAEQDIIVLCRRLIRSEQAYTVVNLRLARQGGDLEGNHVKLLTTVVQDLVKPLGGQLFTMANGDMFVVVRADKVPKPDRFVEALLTALNASDDEESLSADARMYQVPTDYAALRERTNHYVTLAEGGDTNAIRPMRGPLSIQLLAQMEKVLEDVDLGPYLRSQTALDFAQNDTGDPLFEELFTSLPQIRRQLFPEVSIDAHSPLFSAFLYLLDIKVLEHQIRQGGAARVKATALNVTLQTLGDPIFKVFLGKMLEHEAASQTLIELQVGDVFRDIGESLHRIKALQKKGFRVTLDGVTLESAQYLRLGRLSVDWVKLAIPDTQLPLLTRKDGVESLRSIGLERVIVNRFDSPTTMQVGRAFGLQRFQGWLADEIHQGKKQLATLM